MEPVKNEPVKKDTFVTYVTQITKCEVRKREHQLYATLEINDEPFSFPFSLGDNVEQAKKSLIRYAKKLCTFLNNWNENQCEATKDNHYGRYV